MSNEADTVCLILFAIDEGDHALFVAANRDEFHARPSATANWWDDTPLVLGGRDLTAGGTWLGITRTGRFAAVTNYRETPADPLPPLSRGELTRGFLASDVSARTWTTAVMAEADQYRGFNLVVWDGDEFLYCSNHVDGIHELGRGYYGLSNEELNCAWPKVTDGKVALAEHVEGDISREAVFNMLMETGDERELSARFILGEEYGTCASTLVTVSPGGDVRFEERRYKGGGVPTGKAHYEFGFSR